MIAKEIGFPELNRKRTGMSFRVPISDVPVVDLKGVPGCTEDKVAAQ